MQHLPGDEPRQPQLQDQQQQHPLIFWFEREVRPELDSINHKLDLLTATKRDSAVTISTVVHRDSAATGCSPPPGARRGSPVRAPSKRASNSPHRDEKPHRSFSGSLMGAEGSRSPALHSSLKRSNSAMVSVAEAAGIAAVLTRRPDRRTTSRMRGSKSSFADVLPEWSETSSPLSRKVSLNESLGEEVGVYIEGPTRRQCTNAVLDQKMVDQATMLSMHDGHGYEISEKVWAFLEDPDSSHAAYVFARMQPFFITATVLVTLVQTPLQPPLKGLPAAVLEIVVDALFLLEFLVRLATCPNHRAFFLSFYALVDLAAAVPLALRLAYGPVLPLCPVETVTHGLLLFAVPIIRLLKLLRRFQKFHLLLKAFDLAAEALPVLLFILFAIALVFSVLIYLVEQDNITSLPKAFWLTIVTMTTVGYGDMYPITDAGIFITGVLIMTTVLYMAIPLGIVGDAFAQTWQDRDRILLMQRTRERLHQWGYTASDIPVLFSLSDDNDDGELTLHEFRDLLTRMHIGFDDERIMKLFASFDIEKNGTIDARAFVRGLFPNAYHDIFENDEDDGSPRGSRIGR